MKLRPAGEKKDGFILPGATEFARDLGLTKERFRKGTYLFKKGNEIYISFIYSLQEGQGHFKELIENCIKKGYTVKIPTPMGRMVDIVKKNGYEKRLEFSEEMGESVEVWVKE